MAARHFPLLMDIRKFIAGALLQRRFPPFRIPRWVWPAAFVVAAVVVPLIGNDYVLSTGTQVLIYAIIGAGFTITAGQSGVMALGLMMWLQHRFIGGTGNWYLDAMAAMGAGVVVGTLAFPTYVRVVPGRLDVMQCGFLGKLILSRRSIDLRGVRVVVDLATDVIMISDGKGVPPIGYAAVWDRAAWKPMCRPSGRLLILNTARRRVCGGTMTGSRISAATPARSNAAATAPRLDAA